MLEQVRDIFDRTPGRAERNLNDHSWPLSERQTNGGGQQ